MNVCGDRRFIHGQGAGEDGLRPLLGDQNRESLVVPETAVEHGPASEQDGQQED
ncbi:MAG: hypothetical protein ACD_34C00150G0001, partial [uncultured bacterium]